MRAALPAYRIRFLHLSAVWAYGVSQPLFALIDGNPDLLVSRNMTRPEVALFAVLVVVVPPALVTAYVWLAGRFSRWIGDTLFLVALGACLFPLAARVVRPVDFGLLVTVCLVVALAVAGVFVYARVRAARLFLGYSIVLPLAALVWFVHGLPTLTENAEAARVRVASPAPVVLVVLDELPTSSLMTRSGEIDAVRYPNFARLARETTWYPNATTVHEWTSDAVPAILTGRIGEVSTLPTAYHYPENLFTLLGGAYSLRVHENFTYLCPEPYCQRPSRSFFIDSAGLFREGLRLLVSEHLPRSFLSEITEVNFDIALQGASDGSVAEYERFLAEVSQDSADKVFLYDHLLLPHAPWRFFPSGTQYDFERMDGWFPEERWDTDPWPVLQGYQRHLLQVGYLDRLLGQFLRRLEGRDLYDRALIVVTADHGASFRAGEGRRPVTEHNLADIASVPLFVKYPKQDRGAIDKRAARTVDILPTIADVLGVRLPWKVDGESLLEPATAGRGVFLNLRQGNVRRASLETMIRDREVTIGQKFAAFGESWNSLYRVGTNRWLVGREIAPNRVSSATVEVRIANEARLRNVRRASGFVPARISGFVEKGRIDAGTELAVAVNGRIRALTRCFRVDGVQRFRALVPETAFREGFNRVQVFAVHVDRTKPRLVLVGASRESR